MKTSINRKVIYSFILLCLLSRLLIAFRPIEFVDGLTIPDDGYLSLKISKNIASGMGPLYSDSYTNGFQPLYVFLMVPVYILFPADLVTPVNVSLIIASVFDALTLFFLIRMLLRYTSSAWVHAAAAIVWIFNPYIIKNSLNGLETAMSVLMIVITIFYFDKIHTSKSSTGSDHFRLGLITGTAALARIDNFFLILPIAALILFGRNPAARERIKRLALLLSGCFMVYLPWIIYSFAYTGDIYPISGKAVRYLSLSLVDNEPTLTNWFIPMIRTSVKNITANHLPLIIAIVSLFVTMTALRLSEKTKINTEINILNRPIFILFSFGFLIWAAYTFYIFTFWFFDRYLYPVSLFLIVLLPLCFNDILVSQKRGAAYSAALVILALTVYNISSPEFLNLYLSRDSKSMGYMNIGLWANNRFPGGTVIGSAQTGALGYFAESLKVINLDGVVNEECYKELVNKNAMRYIREKGIMYIIDWSNNFRFLSYCTKDYKEGELVFVENVNEFTSWGYRWMVFKVAPGTGNSVP